MIVLLVVACVSMFSSILIGVIIVVNPLDNFNPITELRKMANDGFTPSILAFSWLLLHLFPFFFLLHYSLS